MHEPKHCAMPVVYYSNDCLQLWAPNLYNIFVTKKGGQLHMIPFHKILFSRKNSSGHRGSNQGLKAEGVTGILKTKPPEKGTTWVPMSHEEFSSPGSDSTAPLSLTMPTKSSPPFLNMVTGH